MKLNAIYFNALIFPQNVPKIVKNQCIDYQIPHSGCMFNVTSRWKLWSLQKRNSFEMRAQESQEKTSSAFRCQCIHCMTNVVLEQRMTWLQSHSWSLKHKYCSESKPWKPQEKLHSQFGAVVTTVCSISHQDKNCNHYKNGTHSRCELNNHKK